MCMTGNEALELIHLFEKHGIRHSLIITDIQMPVMNGIELTKNIRNFYKNQVHLPEKQQPYIIGLSGHV